MDTRTLTGDNQAVETAASSPRRHAWQRWLCLGVFVGGLALAVWLLLGQAGQVALALPNSDGADSHLDCLSCHNQPLSAHDTLGSGNQACTACHANPNMGYLRLANGTEFSMATPAPLCAECHQQRYQAWQAGTHGFPGYVAGLSPDGATTTSCTSCHNPHSPRVVETGLTQPHPDPAPPPPPLPTDSFIMIGISVAVLGIALLIALATREKT